MNDLANKHIVLGLSGGIACYKAAELCRAMVKEGATVQVVMTEAAAQFITPVTMQALSNRAVYTSQWDAREPNNMAHINLGREADAIVVAEVARLEQLKPDERLNPEKLMQDLRLTGKPAGGQQGGTAQGQPLQGGPAAEG